MSVAQYTPRNEPNLHAMLWTGKEEDLAEMPGLKESDVSCWVEEDGTLCIHAVGEPDRVARPNQDYLVRGVTGYFFTVKKEKFEREYVPREVLERRPMWTAEQARNVLGEPVYHFERAWVEYDRAANLCERIIGHYETQLSIAALAFEQIRGENFTVPNDTREIIVTALNMAYYTLNTAQARAAIDDARQWLNSLPSHLPQPDWDRAPEWAKWWAVDANGWAAWFRAKPYCDKSEGACWCPQPVMVEGIHIIDSPEHDRQIELPIGVDWRTTLQRRPKHEVEGI